MTTPTTELLTDDEIDQMEAQALNDFRGCRNNFYERAYGRLVERAVLARLGEQQPAAWLWQHEETGRSGFVDAWQVENGWQEANPRNKIIRPVYDHPYPAPVGAQEREALQGLYQALRNRHYGRMPDEVQTAYDKAAEALAARSAAQGAVQVPAGWKLVPVEPTDAMLDATTTCHKGRLYPQDSVHGPRAMRRREYVAMLAAAPAHAGERSDERSA